MKAAEDQGLAVTTLQGYSNIIKSHILPAIGSIRAEDLTARHLDSLYRTMNDKGLSKSRIRHAHAVMRRSLGQAVKWERLERNVAMLASPPSVPRTKALTPSPKDVKAIMEATAAINVQITACFALGALTGARRGEILGLRWSDCDFVSHTFLISRSIAYTPMSGAIVKDTKTHQERRVAMDSSIEAMIQSDIDVLRSMVEHGFKVVDDPYLLFAEPDGSKTFHLDTLSKVFRKVCDQLSLPYHLHHLRHFTGSSGFSEDALAATHDG